MVANEIGGAVVPVTADATPFQEGVEEAVQKAGEQGANKGQKAGSRIGKALGAGLKATAAIAGTAVAGIITTSLVKGFSRLSSIDQAQAKLEGLGVTGKKLQGVMDNALASVKGTAFGLDEAVSAVPGLLAAGVKPGKDLEQALKNMGSAATLAGTSFAETSDVFSDAAAAGHATTETFNRMAERGIPALQMVADHMGVTREEAQKMASQGKISFKTFQDAMTEGIGPAALSAGNSFQGMVQNIGAAMGRLGAVALKPAFEGLKTVMPSVIGLFDRLTEAMKPIMDTVGPGVQVFFERLKGIIDGINFDGMSSALSGLGPLLGGLAIALAPFLGSLPLIGRFLTPIAGLMSPLVAGIGGLAFALSTIKPDVLTDMLDSLVDSIPALIPKVTNAIVSLVSEVVPTLVSNLTSNIPILLDAVLQLAIGIVQAISGALPLILNAFIGLIPMLVKALVTMVPEIVAAIVTFLPLLIQAILQMVPTLLNSAMTLFKALVDGVILIIPLLMNAIITLLPVLVGAILQMLPDILVAAVDLFLQIVAGLLQAIPQIIETLVGMLPELVNTLVGMIPDIVQTAIELFVAIALGILQALPDIITALLMMSPRLIATLISMIPTLIGAAIQLFLAIIVGIVKAVPQIMKSIGAMWPKIAAEFKKMGPKLLQAGKDMITGLVKGLVNNTHAVIDAMVNMANDGINAFKSFFGIKSPSKKFIGFGKDIIDGLAKGLKGSTATAVREMESTSKRISQAMSEGVISKARGAAMKAQLKETTADIVKAMNAREKVLDKLADQRKRVDDLVKQRNDYTADIKAGVAALGSIVKAKSSDSMIANLKKQLEATKAFKTTIAELTKLGLDKGSIEELADNFAKSGDATAAKALLEGGAAAVTEVAELRKQLGTAGEELGKSVGNTLYQAGIDSAQGLVRGLLNDAAALKKAGERMADALTKSFKKKLGIKSPSTVFTGFGEDTMAGYVEGVKSMADDVATSLNSTLPINPARQVVGLRDPISANDRPTAPALASNRSTANDIDINVIGDLHPERTARAVNDALAEKVAVLAAA